MQRAPSRRRPAGDQEAVELGQADARNGACPAGEQPLKIAFESCTAPSVPRAVQRPLIGIIANGDCRRAYVVIRDKNNEVVAWTT
jgi:hypothetical protein